MNEKFMQNPLRFLLVIYGVIMAAGFVLLCLPFTQKVPTGPLDNLFIAVSAVSTTGLTSVSVADNYNLFGQIIVALLIQVGGVHYMAFGSILLLTTRRKLSKFQEVLVKADFGLPDDFDINVFARSVAAFSLAVEAAGAAVLYFVFRGHGVENPLWQAVFHSISAFCTAGFSLFNTSFEAFAFDPCLNTVILALSFLGAVGFIVVTDYWQMWTGRKKAVTFTTRVIMSFSVVAIGASAFLLLATDSFAPELTLVRKFWPALFQAGTALTTVGFNTFPLAAMSHSALYLLIVLMIIGASPAGTGGGIKSTTVVAVIAQMVSTLRGKVNVTFCGRQIPAYRLRLAGASFTFYIVLLVAGVYVLSLADGHSLFEIIFEATSALGTVGLSLGITGGLSELGKAVLVLLMALGRIGPLSLGLALLYDKSQIDDIGWHEDIAV